MEKIHDNASIKRKNFIYIAKFLAVLLVFNSHMDGVYPINALATGGALGNCLFFLISGYTWSNLKEDSFLKWFFKKANRIWLPTVFTNIIFILLYYNNEFTFLEMFKIFIYPNKSWFCGAILLYSVIYYYFVKNDSYNRNKIFLWILVSIYVIWYIFFIDKTSFCIESFSIYNICRIVFYAICMLMGYVYKKNESKMKISQQSLIFIGSITFVFIYMSKFLMNKYEFLLKFQFMNQIVTLICIITIFRILQLNEGKYKNTAIMKSIKWIANYSWEIYLTQTLVIPVFEDMFFPINFVIIIVITTLASIILKKLCMSLEKGKEVINEAKKQY